jgi:hypothetical protein
MRSYHFWWIVSRGNVKISLPSTEAARDCQSWSTLPPTPIVSDIEIQPFPVALDNASATSSCTLSVSIPIAQDPPRKRVAKQDARLTIWRYFEVYKDPKFKHITFCLLCKQDVNYTAAKSPGMLTRVACRLLQSKSKGISTELN